MEQEANDKKFTWAPEKCVYLAKQERAFTLCSQPIPHSVSFKYLGVDITSRGISTTAHIDRLCTNAAKKLGILKRTGFHSYGPDPLALLRVYKAFVRPILEYAIAVMPLCKSHVAKLEQAQGRALKQLLGVPKSTSTGAVLILCNIEPMVCRWKRLADRYQASRESVGADHPIYWVKRAAIKAKSYWAKLIQCKQAEDWNETGHQALERMQQETKAAKNLDILDRPHPVLQTPRQYRWLLINAALGNLARQPTTCAKCGTESAGLSHAYRCLNIYGKYSFQPDQDPLVLLFKRIADEGPTGTSALLATEISKDIWTKCLGRQDPAHC